VTRSRALVPAALGAVVLLALAWFFRPWLHGPAMFLWTTPLVWFPPLVALLIGAALAARARRRITVENIVAPRKGSPILVGSAVVAFVLFLVLGVINGPLAARALYKDTRYNQVDTLPSGANVRLLPKEVAVQIATSGFNSPTEYLSNFSIVRTPAGLKWTALRSPDGLFRTFTKASQGIVTLDAGQTARTFEEVDAELRVAPGLRVTDNLRWRLLKKHFFVELGEEIGVEGPDGRPRLIVPYIQHEGWLVRRPKLGGVFIVAPDGTIEDLEPDEARRRPEIAGSGRLFPERLARRIQDAYAYKRGIWNQLFVHEEQTQITDTEANQQPYLIDFGRERGARWVTVAEPYGRAFAANAVFLTDTLTGRTEVYRVPRGKSLSGNRRALETVRSISIPGVTFADQGEGRGGGRFRAVEPRPVFVDNRLVYLVSVVPQSGNSVSKTVIIDAEQNKQVAIFDNDTDPDAEEKTVEFLRTGTVPSDEPATTTAQADAQGDPTPTPTPTPRAGGRGSDTPAERLDELIDRQRQILEDTEALRRELERQP
jgi:hypothetical protein